MPLASYKSHKYNTCTQYTPKTNVKQVENASFLHNVYTQYLILTYTVSVIPTVTPCRCVCVTIFIIFLTYIQNDNKSKTNTYRNQQTTSAWEASSTDNTDEEFIPRRVPVRRTNAASRFNTPATFPVPSAFRTVSTSSCTSEKMLQI